MPRIPALSPGEFRLIYMKNTCSPPPPSPRGQSVWRKNFRAERLQAGRRGATGGGLGRSGLVLAQVLVASDTSDMAGDTATVLVTTPPWPAPTKASGMGDPSCLRLCAAALAPILLPSPSSALGDFFLLPPAAPSRLSRSQGKGTITIKALNSQPVKFAGFLSLSSPPP